MMEPLGQMNLVVTVFAVVVLGLVVPELVLSIRGVDPVDMEDDLQWRGSGEDTPSNPALHDRSTFGDDYRVYVAKGADPPEEIRVLFDDDDWYEPCRDRCRDLDDYDHIGTIRYSGLFPPGRDEVEVVIEGESEVYFARAPGGEYWVGVIVGGIVGLLLAAVVLFQGRALPWITWASALRDGVLHPTDSSEMPWDSDAPPWALLLGSIFLVIGVPMFVFSVNDYMRTERTILFLTTALGGGFLLGLGLMFCSPLVEQMKADEIERRERAERHRSRKQRKKARNRVRDEGGEREMTAEERRAWESE